MSIYLSNQKNTTIGFETLKTLKKKGITMVYGHPSRRRRMGGQNSTNCDAFDEIEEFFKSGSLLGAAARA